MSYERLSESFKNFDGPFPREGLIESIENREMVTPELLKVMQNALADSGNVIDRQDYMMRIYAMYLLAQFREKKAYPIIIDLFSMPGQKAMEIVGDMYIEDLGRILASVSCGDISLLKQLIENQDAQELLRASAVEALMVLVHAGEQPRAGIMDYFKALFSGKLERRPSLIWVSLISGAMDLYPLEVMSQIEAAFEDGLVDESLIDPVDVERVLEQEKEDALAGFFKSTQYSLIEDVVQELSDTN